MAFEQFHLEPDILSGIREMGWEHPTPIQQQALPKALQGLDILGLAQTGTGKTAAFLLPILQKLRRRRSRTPKSLVLVPTRELAEQVYQDARVLGKQTDVRSVTIYGGVSKVPQTKALKHGVDLVIACPGRLLDHLSEGNLRLTGVEILVLDEADTMCDMGFLPDVRRILQHIPQNRQTLFFSATMPDAIRELSLQILKNPVTVQVDPIAPAATVSHALYPVPATLKKQLLLDMIRQTPTGKVLIFTRTKHRARRLAADLLREGHKVSALQGNMSQNQRQKSMDGFRQGKHDILVATDLAAHGIDVHEITHVINFDMPNTVDAYTHRIGRTGRALNEGEAFTLAAEEDASMVRAVEKVLEEPIERRRLPNFDYGDFNPESQFPVQHQRANDQNQSRRNGVPASATTTRTRQTAQRGNPTGGVGSLRRPYRRAPRRARGQAR